MANVTFKNNGKLKLLIIVGTRPEIIRLVWPDARNGLLGQSRADGDGDGSRRLLRHQRYPPS